MNNFESCGDYDGGDCIGQSSYKNINWPNCPYNEAYIGNGECDHFIENDEECDGCNADADGGDCFVYIPRCFDPETKVMKRNGQYVKVKNLSVGDQIMTLEILEDSTTTSKTFTTVTIAEILKGSFNAHKFVFENGKTLTVTSSHLMIIFKDGNIKMEQVMAMDVKVNDFMLFDGAKMSKVVEIEDVKILNKVNIDTVAGYLYANDIFVTSMCETLEGIKARNDKIY